MRIEGALLLPLPDLPERLAALDRNHLFLVYCHAGLRSIIACETLARAGFRALNMQGGIMEWMGKGFSVAE